MPQPYHGNGDVEFVIGKILSNPFAPHFAKIAMGWTFSEEAWGHLLATMLSFEAGAGLIMYHALTGTGAQRSVLNEVADKYLSAQFRDEFNSIMEETRRRAKERNTVIHGMWFTAKDIPDALILAPRNAITTLIGKVIHRGAKARLAGVEASKGSLSDFSEWRVYRERDFVAIEDRIGDLIKRQDALIDKHRAALGILTERSPALRPLSAS
jgi:hypothetical protein